MAEEGLSGELRSCEIAIMKHSVAQHHWSIYFVMKKILNIQR